MYYRASDLVGDNVRITVRGHRHNGTVSGVYLTPEGVSLLIVNVHLGGNPRPYTYFRAVEEVTPLNGRMADVYEQLAHIEE